CSILSSIQPQYDKGSTFEALEYDNKFYINLRSDKIAYSALEMIISPSFVLMDIHASTVVAYFKNYISVLKASQKK
uniref:Uncharacterized protein n=1 Tax=Anser brachyrhynchus TaxID=132585 RepID=A0A8B9BTD0_9AVES